MKSCMEKEKRRSDLRLLCGKMYYTLKRELLWKSGKIRFAKTLRKETLPVMCFTHSTPLMRKLKDVDMWVQKNKVTNLKLAVKEMNGVLIRPGETLSYWKLIGKPTKRKGYVDGMILKSGSFSTDTGGGLCQLSNLIYWMAVHTPLTIRERHRHSYDVFPDSNRTQPFGSGATCYYNYMDLMIENNTDQSFQLCFEITKQELAGRVLCEKEPPYRYCVYEKDHQIIAEYWGGYTRNNILCRKVLDHNGVIVDDQFVAENHALMMYDPLIE